MPNFALDDRKWVNVGTLPATIINNTPYIIKYIIASAAPLTLNDTSQSIYTETKALTGGVNDRLYLRIETDDRVVFVFREDLNIVINPVNYIITPPDYSLQQIIDAFIEALSTSNEQSFTAAVPIFAAGNLNNGAAYIGFRGRRGDQPDVYYVWDKLKNRFCAYTSTDGLATKTVIDIEASTFFGSLSGNASTASKLLTPRTITITGDITGNVAFDGSTNVSFAATLPPVVVAGTYTKTTVNAKGLVTSGGSLVSSDVTTALGYTPLQASDATSGNTANKIVQRDASGNFLAGTITASFIGPLAGNASTATKLATATTINGKSFDGSASVTLTTQDIAENTNLYYTNTRARLALSASGAISYDNTTGAITVNADIYRLPLLNKSAAYSVVLADLGSLIICNGAANFTLSLLTASSAGAGFTFLVKNISLDKIVTIDAASTETIDGVETIDIAAGASKRFICTGSVWYSFTE